MKDSKQITLRNNVINIYNAMDSGFTAFADDIGDTPAIRLYCKESVDVTPSFGNIHSIAQWIENCIQAASIHVVVRFKKGKLTKEYVDHYKTRIQLEEQEEVDKMLAMNLTVK